MIIFQLRTGLHLCTAKKYFNSKSDLRAFLSVVVTETERFRKHCPEHLLKANGWDLKVHKQEVMASCEVVIIDTDLVPEWQTLFGQVKEITDPILSREEIPGTTYEKKEKFVPPPKEPKPPKPPKVLPPLKPGKWDTVGYRPKQVKETIDV